MRGTQLVRQWKIVRLLEVCKRGMAAAELAVELETSLRNVYRDLQALEAAGFPVDTEKDGKQSLWKLMDGYHKDIRFPFTTTELIALHVSRDILRVLEGTVFQDSIESLFEKVTTSLPPETIRFIDNVAARLKIGFGPPKYCAHGDIIERISVATGQKKRIEISYQAASTGQESKRKIDPYQVWALNGCFYLIGLCHMRNAVRTFAMDRIKDLSLLDETFHFPEDFSLEDYLQTAFRVMTGKPEIVKVLFRASAAQVVKERIWHPTQEIREQLDGSVIITLEVPINYEIISWILGFGSAAKVLEPPSLCKRFEKELAGALQHYGSESQAKTKRIVPKKIPATLT